MISDHAIKSNFISATLSEVTIHGQADQIAINFSKLLSVFFHGNLKYLTLSKCPSFDLRVNPSLFQKLSRQVDKDSMCQRLASFLQNTKHLKSLNLNGQSLSATSLKILTAALSENSAGNWLQELSLAKCELGDDSAAILGTYLHKQQVEAINVGGNRLTFKAMGALMQHLLYSGESGRLKSLDVSDTIADTEDASKQKAFFINALCDLIKKSRQLQTLNISKIRVWQETQQNYLFFAVQLSAAKATLTEISWNGDFSNPSLTAKFSSICLENLPNLRSLSVLPKESKE